LGNQGRLWTGFPVLNPIQEIEMETIIAPKCDALGSMAKKCVTDDGKDLWAELLETLIDPAVTDGITPDLTLSVWLAVTTEDPVQEQKQELIAQAFKMAQSSEELASLWRAVLGMPQVPVVEVDADAHLDEVDG
jgi:hypothetical protein